MAYKFAYVIFFVYLCSQKSAIYLVTNTIDIRYIHVRYTLDTRYIMLINQ